MSDRGGYFIHKTRDGQFYFYLRATDGELLVTSEPYTSKESAKEAIAAVRANADAGIYDSSHID